MNTIQTNNAHTDATHIYSERRQRVAQWLRQNGGGIAILPTAPHAIRNRDNEYDYRADSYFYYLTGFTEPESWLVIEDSGRCTLFCRPQNPEQEIWTGYRLGVDAAPQALGVDAAYACSELDTQLPLLIADQPAIWYSFATHAGLEARISQWLSAVRSRVRTGVTCPDCQRDLCALLDEMRLVKDTHEIGLMRQAGHISALGHARAMQTCARMMRNAQDVREYHLEAELLHEFCRHGAQNVSFNSIVASGANACVLHYRAGRTPVHSGELVLIDAGCEFQYYAGDITRTFPANGRFTRPQRELYDLVLASQQAAIDALRPGAEFNDAHNATLQVLAQGMLDLGLLHKDIYGTAQDVIEQKTYTRFYMHRTSHWLGLDVHDCGSYVERNGAPHIAASPQKATTEQASRILHPGMVLTIEPGIYVRAAGDIPEAFHNIGIRIEDDALITHAGYELLTRDVPVQPDEIEALMAG